MPDPTPPRPPAANLMLNLGLKPDPWQIEVMQGDYSRLLLNCCRQAGKSTAVAMLGLAEAIFIPFTNVLLLSRSHRQSTELFRIVLDFYRRLGSPIPKRRTAQELELTNHSRIFCLPCKEETIRGYSNVALLIIDEASRVPDDLFRTLSPMLAVSKGRMICLSTPRGKRGYFYEAWTKGGDDWTRIEISADKVARIDADHLARERRTMDESWFRQEYYCSFEALEGLVYPDMARCVVPGPAPAGRLVGGIDFGLRNPFAAVWGVLDRDGILWLTGEHYSRNKTLAFHAQHLPKDVMWYADPAGARERHELIHAGFKLRKGDNEKKIGITAVRARMENGSLKILKDACPNLLAEAGLYRYDEESKNEDPVDEYNHALDALRYLLSKIDRRRMADIRKYGPPTPAPPDDSPEEDLPPNDPPANDPPPPDPSPANSAPPAPKPPPPARPKNKWLSLHNEQLWTRLS